MSAFGANEAALQSATQYVANEFSTLFSNNVTLNITITADPSNGLGASSFEYTGTYTYAQVRAALIANASTPESLAAANSLPLTDPTGGGSFVIPNAEAKALGLLAANAPGLDGTFYIGAGNTYTFDPNNRAVLNAYDFIGTAEHEFSEIMGRTSQLTNAGFGYLPFDLFRYTAPGVMTLNPAAVNVYFSVDGGSTVARYYNSVSGGDVQDWASGQSPVSSFDAFGATNEAEPIIPIDVTAMNTIGWQTAVPEPSTVVLTLGALIGLGIANRGRRRLSA